ncbi:MAG: hypothetical protein AAGC93_14465 [Cyanobacteria bacterium P01_F01_bin.53]
MPLSHYLILSRLMSALMLNLCGEFCVFGFLASFEVAPSDRTPWLIGYGLSALFFFSNAIRLGLTAFGTRRTIQRQGLVGLIMGSLISFAPVFLLCLFGPRREFFNLLSGMGFGFLAAPFGLPCTHNYENHIEPSPETLDPSS